MKIIDFGTVKVIINFISTIIATSHYLSPEILLGQGYSFSYDYWSIGIVFKEMTYKKYPFGNHSNDIMKFIMILCILLVLFFLTIINLNILIYLLMSYYQKSQKKIL